jgi:tRNA splicing endonuclease
MIKIEFNSKSKKIAITEPSSVSSLSNGHYGEMKKGVVYLSPEEALYVVDIRNGQIFDESNKEISFNELCTHFTKNKKLLGQWLGFIRDQSLG